MANRDDDVRWRAVLTGGAVRCVSSRWDGEEVVVIGVLVGAAVTILLLYLVA